MSRNKNVEYNQIYWDNFYRNAKFQEESSFCKLLKQWIPNQSLILDVGCGSGRDSFSFAKDGFEVVGIDKSQEAILFNNNMARKMNLLVNFEKIDIGNETKIKKLIEILTENARLKNKNIVIYMRFFLHAIDENAESVLLTTVSKHLKEGDYLAAEFRTVEDEDRKKVHGNHYRRFINAELFLHKLEKTYSFKTLLFQKGTGFALYKDEDPFIARIISKKI